MNMNEGPDIPQRDLGDALAALRESVRVPDVDPARERALLAAFDARQARLLQPQTTNWRWVWTSAAAMLAISVTLNWMIVTRAPRPEILEADTAVNEAEFVPWPGAEAFPPFESGSVVRVNLPVSALPGLGLSAPFLTMTAVQADIVIGQDGLARAVRLVQ
jgi:hypothetical protein